MQYSSVQFHTNWIGAVLQSLYKVGCVRVAVAEYAHYAVYKYARYRCNVYTVYCTVYSLHLHCIHSVQCILCTVHCTMYKAHISGKIMTIV